VEHRVLLPTWKVSKMHYFALLISPERDLTPEEGAEEMAAYQNFHAKASSVIRAGDALAPQSTGVRITGGPDAASPAPTLTARPSGPSSRPTAGISSTARATRRRRDSALEISQRPKRSGSPTRSPATSRNPSRRSTSTRATRSPPTRAP